MTVLLALALVGALIFFWVCLFKIFPDSLLAMFRFRLWRERDELAKEVRAEFYAQPEPAEQVVKLIEHYVELAPQLSPLHIVLMRLSELRMQDDHSGYIDLGELEPEERAQLESRMERVNDLLTNHAMLETPSGWGLLLIGLPFVPIAVVVVAIGKVLQKGYGSRFLRWLRRLFSEGSRELACREHFA
ncbi:MAG TPA: hypothetical protein VFU16_09345 [Solirubrobacterales bacterium]|nr:hypothetical protein [Solirubrobacterales bacterium]